MDSGDNRSPEPPRRPDWPSAILFTAIIPPLAILALSIAVRLLTTP